MNQPLLAWSAELALDQTTMDETHREFVDLLNRVAASSEEDLLASLDEFIVHTEAHFSQEERWMQEIVFPPLHCHQGEHANVLEVIREVRKRVADGQVQLGSTLAQAIAEWFPQHASTMDAMLAEFMKRAGYVPGGDNSAVLATVVVPAAASCGPGVDACSHAASGEKS